MKKLLIKIENIHSQPKGKYFIYLIMILGTSGIWLPIFIDLLQKNEFKCASVSLNMSTFFLIMLTSNSVDKGLRALNSNLNKLSNNDLLNVVTIPILAFVLLLISVLTAMHGFEIISLIISILGFIFSLTYWWKANKDNEALLPTSAIGGDTFNH